MIELDDDAVATALNLEHAIAFDLLEPRKSILLAQLAAARGTAIEATRALIEADPHDPREIMSLQNDVRRFRDLVRWLQNAQTRAAEAFAQLPPEEQEAVIAFTHPTTGLNDA